jgi:hypothetical protein
MVLVMETGLVMLCMPLIVTMSMKSTFVAQVIPSTYAFGGDVVDLYVILIFEKQFTPSAFPLLFLKEFAQGSTQHGVFFESGTPVEEIAVIWACGSSHFDMALNRSGVVPFEHMFLLVLENPA